MRDRHGETEMERAFDGLSGIGMKREADTERDGQRCKERNGEAEREIEMD